MNPTLQLDISLKMFRVKVNKLLEHSSLVSALDANLASLKSEVLFYEIEPDSRMLVSNAIEYIQLIDICLKEFQRLIPRLDGEAWHVDLYREQMDGRKDLIRRLIEYSDNYAGSN